MNFLIHYHEIALKGANRPLFVKQLKKNIEKSLKDFKPFVKVLSGRLFLNVQSSTPSIEKRLKKIPGIANFMEVVEAKDLNDLKSKLLVEIRKLSTKKSIILSKQTFKVSTKRGDKRFPKISEEINREVGAFIEKETGAKVNLNAPDITIFIEVAAGMIFFGFDKFDGARGLPVGVSGKVAALLSGGIDSPVAAFRMMKRGCRVVFVHFHSYPYLDYSSQEKAKELVKVLNNYQGNSKLYLVPFGDIQKEIVLKAPEKYRVIIYRRVMFAIAQKIALLEKAKALVTGESLGQVASQTIENISVIEEAVSLPVFRPLVGMDKEEIINTAKSIGTYEISIMPDQDCCQLFTPRHPATKSLLQNIKKVEDKLDLSADEAGLSALVEKAIEKSETIIF